MNAIPPFRPMAPRSCSHGMASTRTISIIYVKLIASESQVRLTNHPDKDVSPVWSPDGRWIAFLRQVSPERALLLLIPPIGGREKQLGEIRSPSSGWTSRSLAWSPDSQWVVGPSGGFPGEPSGLHAFSLESGEKHRLTTSSGSPVGDLTPAFSPDGKTLVFARFTATGMVSELYLLSLSRDLTPTGEPVRLTFENRRTFRSCVEFRWKPDRFRFRSPTPSESLPSFFPRPDAAGVIADRQPRNLPSRPGTVLSW